MPDTMFMIQKGIVAVRAAPAGSRPTSQPGPKLGTPVVLHQTIAVCSSLCTLCCLPLARLSPLFPASCCTRAELSCGANRRLAETTTHARVRECPRRRVVSSSAVTSGGGALRCCASCPGLPRPALALAQPAPCPAAAGRPARRSPGAVCGFGRLAARLESSASGLRLVLLHPEASGQKITPEITTVKFHLKMQLKIEWTILCNEMSLLCKDFPLKQPSASPRPGSRREPRRSREVPSLASRATLRYCVNQK